MNKFFKTGMVATVVASLALMLSGCFGEQEPEPISEASAISEAYVQVMNASFNHEKTVEELTEIQQQSIANLGDEGIDYENSFSYLETVLPLEHIYINEDPLKALSTGFGVLTLMQSNTVGDVLTTEVDATQITLNEAGDVATIPYTAVKFTSEQDETTGLAKFLNDSYATGEEENPGSGITLHLTDNGWAVEIESVYPVPELQG